MAISLVKRECNRIIHHLDGSISGCGIVVRAESGLDYLDYFDNEVVTWYDVQCEYHNHIDELLYSQWKVT